MPREQINYPSLTSKTEQIALRDEGKSDAPTPEFGPWNDSSLHVGWQGLGADENVTTRYGIGWVQLGLEVDTEYARFAMQSPNGATDDRTVLWTPVLSPAELDKAIAVLKRARRSAHRKGFK